MFVLSKYSAEGSRGSRENVRDKLNTLQNDSFPTERLVLRLLAFKTLYSIQVHK